MSGGFIRFYKSQCKSRDKYYLLFEERHSRYLLYRGKRSGPPGTPETRRQEKKKHPPKDGDRTNHATIYGVERKRRHFGCHFLSESWVRAGLTAASQAGFFLYGGSLYS